jgi:hypothetical protein
MRFLQKPALKFGRRKARVYVLISGGLLHLSNFCNFCAKPVRSELPAPCLDRISECRSFSVLKLKRVLKAGIIFQTNGSDARVDTVLYGVCGGFQCGGSVAAGVFGKTNTA